MDNFHIDIKAEGEENLVRALEIAMSRHSYATHWCDHPTKGMILFWSKPTETIKSFTMDRAPKKVDNLLSADKGESGEFYDSHGTIYIWNPKKDSKWGWERALDSYLAQTVPVHPFPYKMKKATDLARFIQGWIGELPDERYIDDLDHDGSNGRGFRVYNESWGRLDDCSSYSFVAIQPCWAWYGK